MQHLKKDTKDNGDKECSKLVNPTGGVLNCGTTIAISKGSNPEDGWDKNEDRTEVFSELAILAVKENGALPGVDGYCTYVYYCPSKNAKTQIECLFLTVSQSKPHHHHVSNREDEASGCRREFFICTVRHVNSLTHYSAATARNACTYLRNRSEKMTL